MTTPKRRRETWAKLSATSFDLLVIGGGITGAGVARDAAMRGLSVALVEKSDFGSGTSSKSSKLIHGGLRYLQQAEFGLVFEAVSERTLLLRLAPHLVRPLSFLVPSYKGQFPGLFTLDCGLWLYDALSRFAAPSRHRTYRSRALRRLEPGLSPTQLSGGIVYYDSMTDDARLTLENIIDARAQGAVVASYAQVVELTREPGPGGKARITGARVRDLLPDAAGGAAEALIRARVTVNATGPWSDGVLGLAAEPGEKQSAPLLRPTKGVHIVVDAARLPVRHAVVLQSPDDGRVLFAIPWYDPGPDGAPLGAGARTVVGTTDTDFVGDRDRVAADGADIAYLMRTVNHYFPDVRLQARDVLATWAGLRPLIAPQSDGLHASAVSREHRLIEQEGLVTVAGGKLTTFRRMAAQVVDAALVQLGKTARELPCRTGRAPLPGAVGLVDPPGVGEEPGDGEGDAPPVEPLAAADLTPPYGREQAGAQPGPGAQRPRSRGGEGRLALVGRKARGEVAVRALAQRLQHSGAEGLESLPGAGDIALHLARTYGARAQAVLLRVREDRSGAARLDPELPYLMAEVDLAVAEEEALRLDDVLSRRLPLLLRARDQGLGCAERVAQRMAAALGWTAERVQAEVRSYQEVVALSRAYRQDPPVLAPQASQEARS